MKDKFEINPKLDNISKPEVSIPKDLKLTPGREGTKKCKLLWYSKFYIHVILFVGLDFSYNILIYRMGNFVNQYWGNISIYRSLFFSP